MTGSPPRVVYDCNIYVQALINLKGPAAACVELARRGEVTLFVTAFVLEEVRESYRKVPAKYGVTEAQAAALAAALTAVATVVTHAPAVFAYDRDPDDAHYVNLALATGARLIVSRDRDLLDLMNATAANGVDFVRRFPDFRILDPVAFLREFRAGGIR